VSGSVATAIITAFNSTLEELKWGGCYDNHQKQRPFNSTLEELKSIVGLGNNFAAMELLIAP